MQGNEQKDEGGNHVPTILEAVRIIAEKIAEARISLQAQIREAFDEIVALQDKGVTLSQICRGINEAGATISLSHLKVIMSRVRDERGIKRGQKRKKSALEAPENIEKPISAAPVSVPAAAAPARVESSTKVNAIKSAFNALDIKASLEKSHESADKYFIDR